MRLPIAGAEISRYCATQFDGQIGDAAPRIELERGRDRPRRTGGNAARARAAAVLLGRVGLQLERGDDFREEHPVAEPAADEISMLADESQPRPLRQIAFEQRPRIHIPQRTRVCAAQSVHECRELLQSLAQDIVVINVARIARDESGLAIGYWRLAIDRPRQRSCLARQLWLQLVGRSSLRLRPCSSPHSW